MDRLSVTLLVILAAAALGDAGYLGSVSSGASPIGEHPHIEMTAEEVVVELRSEEVEYEDWSARRYYATVTADFLFTNEGDAETVYMYIPHTVMTLFVSVLYEAVEMEAPVENPRVSVDGEPVEVHKLCVGPFDPDWVGDRSWEEFVELSRPLFGEKPEEGEPFYFTNYFTGTEMYWDEISHPADALLAYWEAPFEAGETVLVEYVQEYYLTSDYGEQVFRLTYPLFTGAGWRGDIDLGRVTVVPGENCDWSDLRYYTGLHLPLPEEEEDRRLEVCDGIAAHAAFEKCRLAAYDGEEYERALVWEFSDYEPHPGQLNSCSLYPDIGDLGTYQFMLHDDYEAGLEESYDNPWDYSMIYLYLGDFLPTYFFAVNTEGVPLFDSPGGEELGARIGFTRGAQVSDWEGNWIKVSWRDWESERSGEGWANLLPLDEDWTVVPSLLPVPETYYGEVH
jgi:hypothetical protein